MMEWFTLFSADAAKVFLDRESDIGLIAHNLTCEVEVIKESGRYRFGKAYFSATNLIGPKTIVRAFIEVLGDVVKAQSHSLFVRNLNPQYASSTLTLSRAVLTSVSVGQNVGELAIAALAAGEWVVNDTHLLDDAGTVRPRDAQKQDFAASVPPQTGPATVRLKDRVWRLLNRVYEVTQLNSAAAMAQRMTNLGNDVELSTVLAAVGRQQSVLQDWVMELPRRHQGVLLTAIRSCDLSPKPFDPMETTTDRQLTAYVRWLILVPADEREPGLAGAFMQMTPPAKWKPSEFGHYPQHWLSHTMHALQICGHYHPENKHAAWCLNAYKRIANGMHLQIEGKDLMDVRLTEDRIAKGNVVS